MFEIHYLVGNAQNSAAASLSVIGGKMGNATSKLIDINQAY